VTDEGPVVVYRDRSEDEIRDIALVRREADGRWSEPIRVHDDGFHTDGCPVNGPAVIAEGAFVAVGWYTLGGNGGVRVALSDDGGRSFEAPITLDGADAVGRADLAGLGGEVAVSWMAAAGENGAEIRIARVGSDGAGEPLVVARTDASRAAGVPRMTRTGDSLFLAYTEPAEGGARIRGALVAIDDLPRGAAAPRAQTGETSGRAQRGGLTVGDPMPDATFHDARTGEPIALASIDRPYLIAFFATWCESCREELPALRAIATERGGDASVYSVSIDALPREEIAAFADAAGIEHPVLVDTTHASARFGAPPLPATFVVDRQGVVRFVARGVSTAEELSAAIAGAR
jgi:peroxiredoxin